MFTVLFFLYEARSCLSACCALLPLEVSSCLDTLCPGFQARLFSSLLTAYFREARINGIGAFDSVGAGFLLCETEHYRNSLMFYIDSQLLFTPGISISHVLVSCHMPQPESDCTGV